MTLPFIPDHFFAFKCGMFARQHVSQALADLLNDGGAKLRSITGVPSMPALSHCVTFYMFDGETQYGEVILGRDVDCDDPTTGVTTANWEFTLGTFSDADANAIIRMTDEITTQTYKTLTGSHCFEVDAPITIFHFNGHYELVTDVYDPTPGNAELGFVGVGSTGNYTDYVYWNNGIPDIAEQCNRLDLAGDNHNTVSSVTYQLGLSSAADFFPTGGACVLHIYEDGELLPFPINPECSSNQDPDLYATAVMVYRRSPFGVVDSYIEWVNNYTGVTDLDFFGDIVEEYDDVRGRLHYLKIIVCESCYSQDTGSNVWSFDYDAFIAEEDYGEFLHPCRSTGAALTDEEIENEFPSMGSDGHHMTLGLGAFRHLYKSLLNTLNGGKLKFYSGNPAIHIDDPIPVGNQLLLSFDLANPAFTHEDLEDFDDSPLGDDGGCVHLELSIDYSNMAYCFDTFFTPDKYDRTFISHLNPTSSKTAIADGYAAWMRFETAEGQPVFDMPLFSDISNDGNSLIFQDPIISIWDNETNDWYRALRHGSFNESEDMTLPFLIKEGRLFALYGEMTFYFPCGCLDGVFSF